MITEKNFAGQINWAWRMMLTVFVAAITGIVSATYNKVNESHDFILQQRLINQSYEIQLDRHEKLLTQFQNQKNKLNGTYQEY